MSCHTLKRRPGRIPILYDPKTLSQALINLIHSLKSRDSVSCVYSLEESLHHYSSPFSTEADDNPNRSVVLWVKVPHIESPLPYVTIVVFFSSK